MDQQAPQPYQAIVATMPFGNRPFESDQQHSTNQTLKSHFPVGSIAWRPQGNTKVPYGETWKIIELTNNSIGWNKWSSEIIKLTPDYIDEEDGKFSCGYTAIVRVTLQDGTYHEDVGNGHAENMKGKGNAIEKARKEAVSDGLKRTLKQFGNYLGNSLGDKKVTKAAAAAPMAKIPTNPTTTTTTVNVKPNMNPLASAQMNNNMNTMNTTNSFKVSQPNTSFHNNNNTNAQQQHQFQPQQQPQFQQQQQNDFQFQPNNQINTNFMTQQQPQFQQQQQQNTFVPSGNFVNNNM